MSHPARNEQFYDPPDGDLGRNYGATTQYNEPLHAPFDGPPAESNETLMNDDDRGHEGQTRPGYNLITAEHFAPKQKSEAYTSQTDDDSIPSDRKKRKQYKPISMRTAYLATVVIIALGLIALVEVAIRKLPTDTVNPADLLKYDAEYVIRSHYTSELIASSKKSAESAASAAAKGLRRRNEVVLGSIPPTVPAVTTEVASVEDAGRTVSDVTPVTAPPSAPSSNALRLERRDDKDLPKLDPDEPSISPANVEPTKEESTYVSPTPITSEKSNVTSSPSSDAPAETKTSTAYHDDRNKAPPPEGQPDPIITKPDAEPTTEAPERTTPLVTTTRTTAVFHDDRSKAPPPEVQPNIVIPSPDAEPTKEVEITMPTTNATQNSEDFHDDRSKNPPPEVVPNIAILNPDFESTKDALESLSSKVSMENERPQITIPATMLPESYQDDRSKTPPPEINPDPVGVGLVQEPSKVVDEKPAPVTSTTAPERYQDDRPKKPPPEEKPVPGPDGSIYQDDRSKNPPPEAPGVVTTKYQDDRSKKPPPEDGTNHGSVGSSYQDDRSKKPPPEDGAEAPVIVNPNYQDDRSKNPPPENSPSKDRPSSTVDAGFRDIQTATPPPVETTLRSTADGAFRDVQTATPPPAEASPSKESSGFRDNQTATPPPPVAQPTPTPEDYRDDQSKAPPPSPVVPEKEYHDDHTKEPPPPMTTSPGSYRDDPPQNPPPVAEDKDSADYQDDRAATPPTEEEKPKETVPGTVEVQWPEDDDYRDITGASPPPDNTEDTKGKLKDGEKDGMDVISIIDDGSNIDLGLVDNKPEEPPAVIGHVDSEPIKSLTPPNQPPSGVNNGVTGGAYRDDPGSTPPTADDKDTEGFRDTAGPTPPTPTQQDPSQANPQSPAYQEYRDGGDAEPPSESTSSPPGWVFRDSQKTPPPPPENTGTNLPSQISVGENNNAAAIAAPVPIQLGNKEKDQGKTLDEKIKEWVETYIAEPVKPKEKEDKGDDIPVIVIPSFVDTSAGKPESKPMNNGGRLGSSTEGGGEKPASKPMNNGGSLESPTEEGGEKPASLPKNNNGGAGIQEINREGEAPNRTSEDKKESSGNTEKPAKDTTSTTATNVVDDGSDPNSVAFLDVTTVDKAGKTAVIAVPIPSPATSIDKNGYTVVVALQPAVTTKDSTGKTTVTTPGIIVTTRLPKELKFFSAAIDDHGRLVVLPAPVTKTQPDGKRLVTTPPPITKTDSKGETILAAPPVTKTKQNGDFLIIQPPVITPKSDGSNGISIVVPAKTTTALPNWKTTLVAEGGKTMTLTDIKAPEATKFITDLGDELKTAGPSRLLTTAGRTWLLPQPTAIKGVQPVTNPNEFDQPDQLRMPKPKLVKNDSRDLVESWPELYPILNPTKIDSVSIQYLGVLFALFFAFLWGFTDTDIKRLEQYHQLAKPEGGLIKDTIGYEYTTTWVYCAPFIAFMKKQWAPFLSSITLILAAAALPMLASSVVIVEIHPFCFDKSLDWQKAVYCTPQVVVKPIWARVTQAVLGLIVLLGVILIAFLARRKTGVFGDPAAISGVASLAVEAKLLDDMARIPWREKESVFVKRLGMRRLQLGYFETGSSYEYGLHSNGKQESAFSSTTDVDEIEGLPNGQEADDQDARNGHRYVPEEISLHAALIPYGSKPERPFIMYWVLLIGFFVVHIALIVTIFVYRFTGGDTAFEKFMSGDTVLVRLVLTAAATTIKTVWDPIDRDIRILAPWRRLARGNASPESSIHREYTHNVPLYSTILGLIRMDWLVAMTTLAATLADLLTVFAASVPYAKAYTKFQNAFAGFFCASILCYLLVALVVVILTERRWENTFPRMPYTHLTVLSYIWGSKFRAEYEGLGDRSREERIKRVREEERYRKYGFGWLVHNRGVVMGQAGRYTVGVEEEPLVKKWGDRSNGAGI